MTATVDEEAIERAVKSVFSFKPADIIQQLDCCARSIEDDEHGHFGKIDDPYITWESTEIAGDLKKAAK